MTTRAIISHLRTEFGDILRRLVAHVPGGLAAVLSDDQGDAIDFAHDPKAIPALDVELTGAQVGQTILRLHSGCTHRGWRDPIVLVEADRRGASNYLAATAVARIYVLAFLLDHPANLGHAFRALAAARTHTEALLR